LAAPAIIFAAPANTAVPTRCAISAFVTDNDPAGTNIRASPSGGTLKRIPGGADAVVDIDGVAGDWFRINRAEEVGDNNRLLFHGSGWVHQSVIGLDVANEDPRLYAAPATSSRVIARLVADGSQVTLIGCRGKWAQVRFKGRTGWLSPGGQCSSPLTTCS
jgi:hypothetical protein